MIIYSPDPFLPLIKLFFRKCPHNFMSHIQFFQIRYILICNGKVNSFYRVIKMRNTGSSYDWRRHTFFILPCKGNLRHRNAIFLSKLIHSLVSKEIVIHGLVIFFAQCPVRLAAF